MCDGNANSSDHGDKERVAGKTGLVKQELGECAQHRHIKEECEVSRLKEKMSNIKEEDGDDDGDSEAVSDENDDHNVKDSSCDEDYVPEDVTDDDGDSDGGEDYEHVPKDQACSSSDEDDEFEHDNTAQNSSITDQVYKNTTCAVCQEDFDNLKDLNQHLVNHGDDQEDELQYCYVCGRGYPFGVDTQEHYIKCHTACTGTRYNCSHCGRCFRSATYYKQHLKVHEDKKPYPCSECDKIYESSQQRSRHVKEAHGLKKLRCCHCGKKFHTKVLLDIHLRIHTGERPYKCLTCGKTYIQQGDLKVHQRNHTGERPFACPICYKKYKRPGDLTRHVRNHTGEKPYKCKEENKDPCQELEVGDRLWNLFRDQASDEMEYSSSEEEGDDEISSSASDSDGLLGPLKKQQKLMDTSSESGRLSREHENVPSSSSSWRAVIPPNDQTYVQPPDFKVRRPGGRNLPPRNSSPFEYFVLFLSFELQSIILDNTKMYATKFMDDFKEHIQNHPKSCFRRLWDADLTISALRRWIGLTLNMGLIRKKNLKDYWCQQFTSQVTPYFGQVMPQWLYLLFCRMLHCNSEANQYPRGHPSFDPWHEVRPVLDTLNSAFKFYYHPSRTVTIDESMVGMKNRTAYLNYTPNKQHSRSGIKKFELRDSSNGYVSHVELYPGKEFDIQSKDEQSHVVAMRLMQACNLLNKGYHLVTDNFFTKPKLALALHAKGTVLTGTVCSNTRGLPVGFANQRLQSGTIFYKRQGPLLVCAFREKKSQRKNVLLLSTFSKAANVEVTKAHKVITKPQVLLDYNQGMGRFDLVASEYPSLRYWHKVFFNLIDLAILNAYELYKLNTDAKLCVDKHVFLVHVIEALSEHGNCSPRLEIPHNGNHMLQRIAGRGREWDCVVCSDRKNNKRRRSRFCCPGCNAGVHPECWVNMRHKFQQTATTDILLE